MWSGQHSVGVAVDLSDLGPQKLIGRKLPIIEPGDEHGSVQDITEPGAQFCIPMAQVHQLMEEVHPPGQLLLVVVSQNPHVATKFHTGHSQSVLHPAPSVCPGCEHSRIR